MSLLDQDDYRDILIMVKQLRCRQIIGEDTATPTYVGRQREAEVITKLEKLVGRTEKKENK